MSKIVYNEYRTEEFLYDVAGNITRINDIGISGIKDSTFYSFDKNPNPYKNNPSKFMDYEFINVNNVTEMVNYMASSESYTCKYDKAGYPITRSYYYSGNQFITRYIYE